ncbi:hypothetical protein SBF1_3470003 [Candidatus Desulfosporosinus infrequens]|uniref:Uncharacterized protein n=1 Tax=Candidatus Desulfosporosinus infrequens TaxID=2043169 RepID=A0A2U3L2M3_9FIRM|nr:hypothetical protein SBF1_3470003 [Candidatus Desulfosporosinus infrequens]
MVEEQPPEAAPVVASEDVQVEAVPEVVQGTAI